MYSLKEIISGRFPYIWIYGAGKTGIKVWDGMNFLEMDICGFVESMPGKIVSGAMVQRLEEVCTPPDLTAFIITTPECSWQDVVFALKCAGYKNCCIWGANTLCELWRQAGYVFEDRRKGTGAGIFVLAGYKEYLWDYVFERLSRFVPPDIDICIISPGKYNQRLAELARVHEWSYLSTKKNSVTLAQNIAFAIFEKYEWIYKMDEDIFVTEYVFENLYQSYREVEETSNYRVGVTVPLMPVNGCGYHMVLEKAQKKSDYEKKFGKIVIGGNPESEIERNPESAVFMWAECPHIDKINRMFSDVEPFVACGVRYSIGFILMRHSFWEEMQGFSVSGGVDMGVDEEEVCASCINRSRALVISRRAVAGHFSFGPQTERMKWYLSEHPEKFEIC